MDHRYSTWILVAFGFLLVGTLVFADIDGSGSVNVLAKFKSGGVISNSSVTDNGTRVNVLTSLSVQSSLVCTASNGLCVGSGSSNLSSGVNGCSGNVTLVGGLSGFINTSCALNNYKVHVELVLPSGTFGNYYITKFQGNFTITSVITDGSTYDWDIVGVS